MYTRQGIFEVCFFAHQNKSHVKIVSQSALAGGPEFFFHNDPNLFSVALAEPRLCVLSVLLRLDSSQAKEIIP